MTIGRKKNVEIESQVVGKALITIILVTDHM